MRTPRSYALVAVLALLLVLTVGLTVLAAPPTPEVQLLASGTEGLTLEVVVPEPRPGRLSPSDAGPAGMELEGYRAGPEGLPVRDLLLGLPPEGMASVRVEPLAPTRIIQGPVPAVRVPYIAQEQEGMALKADWRWQPVDDRAHRLPLADLADEGYLRDWRVGRLRLAPMAYLGEGRWEFMPRFRVLVTFEGSGHAESSVAPAARSSVVARTLLNGEQAAGWRSADPPVRSSTVYTLPELAWRIGVTADGMVRLTYEALEDAQVPVDGTEPTDLHLLWRGQEVAMQEVGMADNTLNPGDSFLFYGQKFHGSVQDEKYTDENVYWLVVDDTTPGKRMASRPVPPDGAAPAASWYMATVRAEQDDLYWARWSVTPGTDATWFWERVVTVSTLTKNYALELADLSPSSHMATLRVEVAARSSSTANPDHHLGLGINGTAVGEVFWDGQVGQVFTLPFSSALLREGANEVDLTFLTDVGVQDIYVNWVEITFRRKTVAEGSQLALVAPFDGEARYTLEGFAAEPSHLYDLSDPHDPVILSAADVTKSGPTWDMTFEDNRSAGQPYLALAEPAIRGPSAIRRYQPRLDLLSPALGADEIIIVAGEFYTASLSLAEHRRDEGLRVEVVRVEDLYPLFNAGVFHPEAIRDFLAYAYEHWQPPAPAYVLFVGDGHFNFKGHNPARYGDPTPVYIPPYLDFVDPWQGEVPVDTRFVQVVGEDTLPDMAVGRLAVNSAQETAEAVAKIIGYETSPQVPGRGRLIFVADNIPDEAGDFEGVLDRLAADLVPGWMHKERVYLTEYCGPPVNPPSPCISATQALTETWSQGAAMLTFLGHGSVQRWTHEPLLLNTQIDTLRPGYGLPLVITLNCLDGYWMMPPKYPGLADTRSMAEWASTAADHGSIASFSPAGLGTTSAEEYIVRNMYGAVFEDREHRLGELALIAQLTTVGYPPHLREVSTLFGDPGGSLRIAQTGLHLPLVLRGR